jgi:DNA-binding NarL/FixJ family response regulator
MLQMQSLETFNLYVAADSKAYAESLKHSIENSFDNNVKVEAFDSKESCISKMYHDKKPDIVLLDYKLNKNSEDDNYAVDEIKAISPDTVVIMMSNEEDMQSAMKALRYGADDYVMKDMFAFPHIKASVSKCLQPSKY